MENRQVTTAISIPQDETSNPIISKSGNLIYWKVIEDKGIWASLIGYKGVRSSGGPWKIVGISFDQKAAENKARGRAVWESSKEF